MSNKITEIEYNKDTLIVHRRNKQHTYKYSERRFYSFAPYARIYITGLGTSVILDQLITIDIVQSTKRPSYEPIVRYDFDFYNIPRYID